MATALAERAEAPCAVCGESVARIERGGMSLQPAVCDRCVEERQRRQRVANFRHHLLETGLDEGLWSYDQVLAPNPELLAWCLRHAGQWMWLGGPTGTGKTRAVARALVVHSWKQTHWPSALWLPAALWVQDLHGRQEEARGRQHRQIELARRVDILVFDDFGQEELSDHARALLFGLLDHRYVRRLRTWFTSNASPAELVERIGETRWPQMLRRIRERGRFYTWIPGKGWVEEGAGEQAEGTRRWWEDL